MRRREAFTLVELMVVMVIIGILMTFVLRAYSGSVRQAEEKATVALIAKLEQALTDRVDAITTSRADPTPAHLALAAIYNGKSPRPLASVQRAQAIAQFDDLRAQLPDVFVVLNAAPAASAGVYPLSFAAAPFGTTGTAADYTVPVGTPLFGGPPVAGMYGAAFEIAAGVYKQLGYNRQGWDGNDNNNDGFVDDLLEGTSGGELAAITARLQKHTHKTARAEMLYAILVEGGGAYGSSFDKDDFTSKEVQDTDGDGLLEFVDAWGEPLQFYRWPILHRSDAQKGWPDVAKLTLDAAAGLQPGPYAAAKVGASAVFVSMEAREQNPLDPNQTLVAPSWWGATYNNATPYGGGSGNVSGSAAAFMALFGPTLVDPIALSLASPAPSPTCWDRSTNPNPNPQLVGPLFYRRAYYSRPLILSAGPDKVPGTAMLGVNYAAIDDRATIETPTGVIAGPRDASGGPAPLTIENLLIEGGGGKVDPNRVAGSFGTLAVMGTDGRNDTSSQLESYAQDDITSHTLQATGGTLR
jgi:prepilin-type N-terminal cleavage/methylation domain-containing protein